MELFGDMRRPVKKEKRDVLLAVAPAVAGRGSSFESRVESGTLAGLKRDCRSRSCAIFRLRIWSS